MKRTIILSDPEPTPPARSGRVWRALLSLGCALAADGIQWLFPPSWVVADGLMVLMLLLVWGRRWEILVAVVPEVIPGLDLFPTWTLFVGYLMVSQGKGALSAAEPPSRPERPMKRVGPE